MKNRGKIFVYSLEGRVTGGCELLHQLVGYLNDNGKDAYIVYVGPGLYPHEVPEAYKKYNIQVAQQVEDIDENIVVIDEGFMYLVSTIKMAQCCLWWLSVDNFFLDEEQLPFLSWYDIMAWNKGLLKKAIKMRLHYMRVAFLKKSIPWYPIFSIKSLVNKACVTAYQSEYARLFLENKGFKNLIPLSDYINTDFITDEIDLKKKENIVLYNPKKGFEFTKRIIEADASIKWIPLINMSRQEMVQIMQRAKVYVDFGFHPGKDRIPREAALNYCCVITGCRGAAGNPVDVFIPESFKLDERKVSVDIILEKIHDVFCHYENCLKEQEAYRNRTIGEREKFFYEIDRLFGLNDQKGFFR